MENKDPAYYTGSPFMRRTAGARVILPGNGLWRVEEQTRPFFEAIGDLAAWAPPGTTLTAMPYAPLFNFLLHTPNPLSFDIIHPHITLDSGRREILLDQLHRRGPRYLLLSESEVFFPEGIPDYRRFRKYAREIYEEVIDNYSWVHQVPGWWLFRRGASRTTRLLDEYTRAITIGDGPAARKAYRLLKLSPPPEKARDWSGFLDYLSGLDNLTGPKRPNDFS